MIESAVQMDDQPKPKSETDAERPARKPYEKPKLIVYGDVAKLTQHKSKGSVHDGGSGSHSHTT